METKKCKDCLFATRRFCYTKNKNIYTCISLKIDGVPCKINENNDACKDFKNKLNE